MHEATEDIAFRYYKDKMFLKASGKSFLASLELRLLTEGVGLRGPQTLEGELPIGNEKGPRAMMV